jgi:hypothetical protein
VPVLATDPEKEQKFIINQGGIDEKDVLETELFGYQRKHADRFFDFNIRKNIFENLVKKNIFSSEKSDLPILPEFAQLLADISSNIRLTKLNSLSKD